MRSAFLARCALLLLTAAVLSSDHRADAEDITVPVALQVDLLGRVTRFERNFLAHMQEPALVLIVARDNAGSSRAAAQVAAAVADSGNLGGRVASTKLHRFSTASALLAAAQTAAVVYVMAGFDDAQIEAIGAACESARAISVGVSADDVPRGVVLAFELSGGKPKIVLNLRRARAQRLDFNAQLLRLARVIQ